MSTTIELGELTGDYVLDTARTRVGFVARHTLGSRVRGHFEEFEGGARLDGDRPARSSAWLVIRAASIRTGNRQRDEQLCGTFLDAAGHPSLTFASAEVTRLDGSRFRVTGDLTIRGTTRPVTFDLELTGAGSEPHGGHRVAFRGGVTVDRGEWGVNWNALTSLLLSPKVTLEFDVTAIRQP
ncbi:YceI family protein [Streptomyces sp. NPDC050504]|uniref:YceI family protein n=1 Tax=Streptomyces sp. NPDC050504 TaxID=3365618 RepID=UPI0037926546